MTYPVSPYNQEGGLYHFPRMLDKIRLNLKGELDTSYLPRLGKGLDGFLCRFVGVQYDQVATLVEEGKNDAEIVAWCEENGVRRHKHDRLLFNKFVEKLGWRDEEYSQRLMDYKKDSNLSHRNDIVTFFDLIEVEEGRKP